MRPVRLVVQGDDFGMCHAVNVGTVAAFVDGILTQASTMVPCPWFDEAAALAREHRLPLGIHQTLTCEWDHLRWRPLTAGPSLVGPDGTFHRTVADARDAIDRDDAIIEIEAQTERFLAAGLDLTYYDVHMGVIAPEAYEVVAERRRVPFLYPGIPASLTFGSIRMLSERPAAVKKEWMLRYLERRAAEPGLHLLVAHCAVAGDEIGSITRADSAVFPWAEEYRVSDLAVLTDPEVRAAVDDLGIELTTVRDAFAVA
ncbi:MAG TPA: ChbG/HpnK family deacetylase [Acidimicrobiales bacterium]|nr:ChbG/HpnK family deacetylase [Acidimicrobiales bacterium]